MLMSCHVRINPGLKDTKTTIMKENNNGMKMLSSRFFPACSKRQCVSESPATGRFCLVVLKDSSAIHLDRAKITFIFSLFIIRTHYPIKEGGKTECLEKSPNNKLQKVPHTKAQNSKP